jgi:hypothetical protein
MTSTYTTGFGIEKIGSGEQSGAWGTTTNHNLDILDRIASYKAVALSGTTHTLTVREASPGSGTENLQDGMYRVIKFTGALGGNNTVTIAPNTSPAYFIIENATTDSGSSGPYSVILTQGSGANVTVQNGKNAIIYCDGAGSGAVVYDALADLQVGTLEVTGAASIDGALTAAAITATTLTTSGIASIDDTTDTTSGTTGSIHTDGGVGVAKALYVGTTAKIIGVTTHGDDVVSDTDSTDDLGTTGVRWANLFVDGITATDQVTATGFTGTLDGILGSGTPAAATVTTIDASGVATATTFEPDGDTAAGDNAAIGYTAAEGLILTGQGSTSDVTIKNDADATVMSIPTGTTNVGIGTTAPAQILETKELAATGFTGIRINNPNENVGSAGIEFQVDETYSKAAIYQLRSLENGGGAIVFVNDSNLDAANWVAGDEKMRITSAGLVGIGTTAPATHLDVAGSIRSTSGNITVADGGAFSWGSTSAYVVGSSSTNVVIVVTSSAERMRIDASGNVGIGTASPATTLDVTTGTIRTGLLQGGYGNSAGNFHIDAKPGAGLQGATYINWFSGTGGLVVGNGASSYGIAYASAFTILSDRRLKENISYFDSGLAQILQLKPATFDFINGKNNQKGFIAQDVETVIPEVVATTTMPDSSGDVDETNEYLTLNQSAIIPYLVAAIKEQQVIIESLKTRITALEG